MNSPSWIFDPADRRFHRRSILVLLTLFAASNLVPSILAQQSPAPPQDTTATRGPDGQQGAGTQGDSESQGQTVVLQPFEVSENSDVGYGASASASTSRMAQNYIDIQQSVNVVTAQFMSDFNLMNARDVLDYVSSTQVGLSDSPSAIQLRGAKVLSTNVDGDPIPITYIEMPLPFFDRVEIVKGPSSAAFGLGEPGGEINYVSKTPTGIESGSLTLAIGDNENYSTDFDVQGVAANSKLSYRVAGFYDQGYTYFQTRADHHDGAGAQLALKYDLDKTTTIQLILAYSQTTAPNDRDVVAFAENPILYALWQLALAPSGHGNLPGTTFNSQGQYIGGAKLLNYHTQIVPDGTTYYTVPEFRSNLIINKDFANGHIHLRNDLLNDFSSATQVFVTGFNIIPAAAAEGIYETSINRTYGYTNSDTHRDDLSLIGDLDVLGGKQEILVGVDAYDDNSSGYEYGIPAINANGTTYYQNFYAPNPTPMYMPPMSKWTLETNSAARSLGDGFYATDDASYFGGRLVLSAGWRIDYFDTTTYNYSAGSVTAPGWQTTKGAPRFAATIKPLKWLSFYGLYSVHHDPVQSTEKYFLASGTETPTLLAEYPINELEFYQPGGYTVEFGAKASFLNGKIYASVAAYHEILTGQINALDVPGFPVTNPDGSFTAIGENLIEGLNAHGIEAELIGQITPRLSVIANYGLERGEYPTFANGETDWFDPSWTVTAHGKFDFGDLRGNGFYVTFGGQYFSPYWIYENPYFWYPNSQITYNGGVGYQWRSDHGRIKQRVYLNCDNITNQFVSMGTITWAVAEPMRQTWIKYTISY